MSSVSDLSFSFESSDAPDDTIGSWLSRVGHGRLLTLDQEVRLAQRIERGDEAARARLAEANLRLVVSIARRYQGIPMVAASCLSAVLCVLAVLPFAQWNLPSIPDLFLLVLFGLVNSALRMTLFAIGSKWLPATETALIGALDAPLAPVWILLVFGEMPGDATLVGGAIVFAAILAHMLLGAEATREQ